LGPLWFLKFLGVFIKLLFFFNLIWEKGTFKGMLKKKGEKRVKRGGGGGGGDGQ